MDIEYPTGIDADELGNSLTGFEEIAIEGVFRKGLTEMGAGTTSLRALYFIALKRSGMADVDAFRNVMLMPLKDVYEKFRDVTAEADGGKE